MRRLILNVVFAFIVLFSFVAPGCSVSPASKPVTGARVTDQLGREVKLEGIPQRIISLAPSNTEIVFALGLADKLVAVTDYCNYPPEAKQKPSIGGFTTPNMEKIVSLSPDLVLVTSIHQKTVIPYLEERGIKVFALAPKTLDEILDSIVLVGQITGAEGKAAALVADMQKRIKSITDKTANLPDANRPAVFYLTWHNPLMTSGLGTLHHELILKAGGKNLFGEIIGTQTVDLELLLVRNPQVMIAGVGMGTGEFKTLEYLKSEPRLQNTDARKNARVYASDTDLTGRAGPRIVEGLEQFAKCIHPEIFGAPASQ